MEAALLAGGIFENSAPKSKETHNVKKEDVELIVREYMTILLFSVTINGP